MKKHLLLLIIAVSIIANAQTDIDKQTKGQLPIDRLFHGSANFCLQMDSSGTHVVWAACASGGGSGYNIIQNAASAITQRTVLNFAANIFCTDNAGASRSDCNLSPTVSTQVFDASTGFRFSGTAGAGKVLIGDGTNFVPGDPLVQGVHADGSTVADNPVVIGGYDTAGTPVLHRSIFLNSTPAGSEYGLLTRNIPSGTQAISAASLPLPSGAATESTLGSRLADTTFTGRIPTNGQKAMTGSIPVVVASDQSAIPISAASLPLPSGASTSAKQPALGTAGSPSADVITIQGIASMTAVKVDGSAVTQPISASSLPLPTGAAQDSTLTGGTVKAINRGGAKGTTTAADVTSTASGANHQALDVAQYDASGNQLGLSASPVRVDPTGTTTQPVSIAASVTVTQSTASNLKVDLSGTAANATAIKVDGSAVTQPVSIAANVSTTDAATSSTGSAVPAKASYIGGSDGTNLIGMFLDPCKRGAKTYANINLTASGQIITGAASKKTYICSLILVSAAANNVALVEGTGTTCATSIAGMSGGTTAATGWNFGANGGLTIGNGDGGVFQTATNANNVCLLLSAASQVSGTASWVQF